MRSPFENRPPCAHPRVYDSTGITQGLIETSGKIPTSTRNPADKVHYIVRFMDWLGHLPLTHSVTLALDVPKTGTLGSGELENRQTYIDIPTFLLLSGPIRKRIHLGREYLNRTNRTASVSVFASEQNKWS